jgi:hypothetical protein
VYENGVRRTRTLGAWGSPEADEEYKRFLAEFATGATERSTGPDVTVNEMLLAFFKHAERHYCHPDGTPTSEIGCLRLALKPLRELYGYTPAREFGPRALKTLREHMIGRKWARRPVNAAVERAERERVEALDAPLVELDELVDLVVRAALAAAGYAQHNRGEWRKRRVRHHQGAPGEGGRVAEDARGDMRVPETDARGRRDDCDGCAEGS